MTFHYSSIHTLAWASNHNEVHDEWKQCHGLNPQNAIISLRPDNQGGRTEPCASAQWTNIHLPAHICDIIQLPVLRLQSASFDWRSTVRPTMTLCDILDICGVSKHIATVVLIDFSKAFDSIV